jgi:hypothetical protein
MKVDKLVDKKVVVMVEKTVDLLVYLALMLAD